VTCRSVVGEKTDILFIKVFQHFDVLCFINIIILLCNQVMEVADAIGYFFVCCHAGEVCGVWFCKSTKKAYFGGRLQVLRAGTRPVGQAQGLLGRHKACWAGTRQAVTGLFFLSGHSALPASPVWPYTHRSRRRVSSGGRRSGRGL
jgi:hypothetical protein